MKFKFPKTILPIHVVEDDPTGEGVFFSCTTQHCQKEIPILLFTKHGVSTYFNFNSAFGNTLTNCQCLEEHDDFVIEETKQFKELIESGQAWKMKPNSGNLKYVVKRSEFEVLVLCKDASYYVIKLLRVQNIQSQPIVIPNCNHRIYNYPQSMVFECNIEGFAIYDEYATEPLGHMNFNVDEFSGVISSELIIY